MRVRWDRSKGVPEPLSALDKIVLVEKQEPLADLRQVCPSVSILRPSVIPYLRSATATMLERAGRSLPKGFKLGVSDAWRPLERQKHIYDWMFECAREAFPNRSFSSLKRTVNRVVHAYGRRVPPGHCTGGAIDVNLVDPAGLIVDVSEPYDRFSASRTYTLGLLPQAEHSRAMLVDAMLAAGFSNCRDEWWHYSYGDAAWAVRTASPACSYGLIELPKELYADAERAWLESFKERPNPFLEV